MSQNVTSELTFDFSSNENGNNTNDTERITHPLFDGDKTVRNVFIIACYLLIVIVSFCGNSLVCRVAFCKKKMRTTTNLLIASLACSDLVMTVFNIPFNVARLLLPDWPFGSVLCFLVPFVQVACVYVSTFTMTVIALHRWWTINKRSVFRSSSHYKLLGIIIILWSLAFLLSLPHSIFNRVQDVEVYKQRLTRCRVSYPQINFDFFQFLSVEVFLTQYIIPLSITCALYIKIGSIVSRQGLLAGKSNDERKRHQMENKRRRIIMLALVVIVFALCWLPLDLYHLLVDFKVIKHSYWIFLVCHWFAMSSVCYNPFIYCWFNASFRKGAKESLETVFRCLKEYKVQSTVECPHDDADETVRDTKNVSL